VWLAFDLGPQPVDMDVDGPRSDQAFRVLGERDQLTPAECPAGVAGECGEEVEFPGAQVDGPPVMPEATADEIQLETVGYRQVRPRDGWRVAAVATGCRLDVEHRRILEPDG